ncbi:MAG: hypothetical protein A2452_12070 [Candidatus Firestonebacteria bacterium RIFOXYC2_FULL_39_67]|nr:MAG: hypothetical protein A2536_00265 [Candidatus Firestonebacteria bacterium RIFOXYD2_FULL_39_29]OGF55703.1 MAG: hypothetical protein A2452_12070 [Candidatus Firestonebacteria bacterium RIFOXYC2_FULL_39_67]
MKIKKIERIGIGILSVVLLSSLSWAAENNLALPSTQEGGTARAMSMGSAVVGLPQGAASLFWNPAALGGLSETELGLHHNSGLGESTQETVVFGMPVNSLGGFAASLNYVDNGTFEGRDSVGDLTADYTAGNLGLSLGWGKYLLPGISAGVAVKYNRESLAAFTYQAISMDIGFLWTPVSNLYLGLTYANLGIKVSSALSDLESVLRFGASYEVIKNLIVAASSELKAGNRFDNLQVGAEGFIDPMVALRAGYVHNFTDFKLEGLTGFTAGLGVVISKSLNFDYAFVPYGELGNSHRLSLTYKFLGDDKITPEKPASKVE